MYAGPGQQGRFLGFSTPPVISCRYACCTPTQLGQPHQGQGMGWMPWIQLSTWDIWDMVFVAVVYCI